MRIIQWTVSWCLVVTVLSTVNQQCRQHYQPFVDSILTEIANAKNIFSAWGFPICLDRQSTHLTDFVTVLNKYNDPAETIPFTFDATSKYELKLHRLKVKDPSVFVMRNWLNLHFSRKSSAPTAPKIRQIIIQGITSPIGLPYLEFRPDAKCSEHPGTFVPVADKEMVVPCKYRPKSAIRHPNVYIVKKSGTTAYDNVQVNFNFIDVMCHEVTAIQFGFLVEFDDSAGTKEAYLSQVFLFKAKDSDVGIPLPFHTSFNDHSNCKDDSSYSCLPSENAQCNSNNPRPTNVKDFIDELVNKRVRIIYNKEYDECIQQGTGLTGTKECPPGPFYCSETRSAAATANAALTTTIPGIAVENNEADYRAAVLKAWAACPYDKNMETGKCKEDLTKYLEDKCRDVFRGSGIRSLGNARILNEDDEDEDETIRLINARAITTPAAGSYQPDTHYAYFLLRNLTVSQRVIDRSEHGALMIAAFFVVISGSNFLARFFKETGGESEETENGCCGYRCWLLVHMALSFISLYLIWMSLAMPMDTLHCQAYPGQYNITECVENPTTSVLIHKYLGFMIIAYVHINFSLGWIRPLKRKLRDLFTAIHSYSGHLLQFLVFINICYTKVCQDVLLFVVSLMVLGFALSGLATFLQWKNDKAINLQPKRKLFPIAEHVMSQECKIGFILQLWIHWIGHCIFYVLILFSYKVLITDGRCWLSK